MHETQYLIEKLAMKKISNMPLYTVIGAGTGAGLGALKTYLIDDLIRQQNPTGRNYLNNMLFGSVLGGSTGAVAGGLMDEMRWAKSNEDLVNTVIQGRQKINEGFNDIVNKIKEVDETIKKVDPEVRNTMDDLSANVPRDFDDFRNYMNGITQKDIAESIPVEFDKVSSLDMQKLAFNLKSIPGFLSKLQKSPKMLNYYKTRLGQDVGGALLTGVPSAIAGGTLNAARGALFDKRDENQGFLSKAMDDFGKGAVVTGAIGAVPGAIKAHKAFSKLRSKGINTIQGINTFKSELKAGKHLSPYGNIEAIKNSDMGTLDESRKRIIDNWNTYFGQGFFGGVQQSLDPYWLTDYNDWIGSKFSPGTVMGNFDQYQEMIQNFINKK